MKTLFTATIAVVLLLFIGWSIISDSKGSNDPEQVRRETAANYSPNSKIPKTGIEEVSGNDNRASLPVELPKEEKDISVNDDPAIEANNTISEMESESNATNRSKNKSDKQAFAQRVPERKTQPNPGDMSNEKFVKEIEKHQTATYRNYDEILRLAK